MTYTITGPQRRLLLLAQQGFAAFAAVTQEALDTEYLWARGFLDEDGGHYRLSAAGRECLRLLQDADAGGDLPTG